MSLIFLFRTIFLQKPLAQKQEKRTALKRKEEFSSKTKSNEKKVV